MADFSNLTELQQELLTFHGWRVGQTYPDGSVWFQPRKSTIRKLQVRGLIFAHVKSIPPSCFGGVYMEVIEWHVPLSVHMAWCEHCSRQQFGEVA